ncbi:MAG TPA: hypothetical protein VGP93_17085, partial [Polyangiaceae bacterium]|nr:hypothetical protein [Polyangiaceae bacterium]
MELWNVRLGAKSTELVHDLAPGFGHALLSPLFTYVFRTLRVGAAVWEHADIWFTLHDGANLALFEQEHGKDVERNAYNARCFAEARRKKALVVGEFGGYSDLFVPVVAHGKVAGIIVTGPLSSERATSTAVEERWHSLTGRAAHPTDAEFASYLAATLNLLVLAPTEFRALERLLRALATLMAGEGDATELANQIEMDRSVLDPVRAAERA